MAGRWGNVELDIVARLAATVGTAISPATVPLVRHVAAGSSEDRADEAPKAYPAVIVIFAGATVEERIYGSSAPGFLTSVIARYRAIGYAETGKTDDQARQGTAGIYAVMEAVREALLGFTPPTITDNAWFLLWESESGAESYKRQNGTGGLKMTQEYSLRQTIPGTIS